MKTETQWLRRLPLILVGLVAVVGAVLLRDQLTFEALQQHRLDLLAFRDENYLVAVPAFVLSYIAIVAFSLPGATVWTLAGGFLFSVFPGVLFNITGATFGAIGIFTAARMGLGEQLAAKMQSSAGRIGTLKKRIDENQWSMLFLIRLLPIVPFFVANLLPALVGVPLRRFAISTALGIVPGTLIYTSVGAGLGAIFDSGGTPDLGIIFEPQFFLPILGLSALAALPMVLRLFQGKKGPL